MTVRFVNYRLGFYIGVFILSAVVLGLVANFTSIFFPKIHRDFIIFALIAPAFTIFAFLLTLQWAQPQTEAIALTLLSIIWLTMGAWSTDIIGNVQCDALGGQRTPAKSGDTNAQAFCYEMKVVQAFSWALFIGCILALYVIFQLVDQAQRVGRYHIWSEPIRELPWFGEMPGYYNTLGMGGGPMPYPGSAISPGYGYPYNMPMAAPGHSIVIQPGMNGAPPTVTQVH
ncbi:hypothetical protein BYT27DRAFT_7182858 [Phlegmacium glaucopus]|nr:hypothetical protein BYT27DRAFT_7182858 [Phlegmacium glaucopus]